MPRSVAEHETPTSNPFFDRPILNSPYAYPERYWELEDGQPTQQIIERRRPAAFVTPIPRPKKRRGRESATQTTMVLDEGLGMGISQDKGMRGCLKTVIRTRDVVQLSDETL